MDRWQSVADDGSRWQSVAINLATQAISAHNSGMSERLPIFELEAELKAALKCTNRVIIEAPTGSGKSTQVPQMLIDSVVVEGQVVVLQPRRLAARMLARHVARERRCNLGSEVGYQVRFDNRSSSSTRIKYETDGIMLRQLLGDPELRTVGAVVLDEFHERHLYGDISLASAMQLQQVRPGLKLIVMSATLNAGPLEEYLAPCESLSCEGRVYPVDVRYARPGDKIDRDHIWDSAADQFSSIAREVSDGHFLVFMPGAYEIRRTVEAIKHTKEGKAFDVLPLHGDLSAEHQDLAVDRSSKRRVIVSTNIAETSLTIDGVTAVIDSGLARKPKFDPHRGINTLLIERISRASADQRAGRAGRTRPGICLRMWTERDHKALQASEVPEVQRLDIAEVVLLLKQAGVRDISSFPWLDAPDPMTLERTVFLLVDLGAIEHHNGAITEVGRKLLSFPAHPRCGRMILAAEHYGCVPSVALIAALLQEKSILLKTRDDRTRRRRDEALGEAGGSDLLLLMRAWDYARDTSFDVGACRELGIHADGSRRVERLYHQFLDIAEGEGLDTFEDDPPGSSIQRCILAGFSDQLGRRVSKASLRYELVHGRRGTLVKESVVRSQLLVASSIHEIGGRRGDIEVRLSMATAVEVDWLREMFPLNLRDESVASYSPTSKRVEAREQLMFRDLVIELGPPAKPSREQAASLLAAEVVKGNLTLKKWDNRVEQWINRVNLLGRECPDLGIDPINDGDRCTIIEQVCLGAYGYKEIKERSVWPALKSWLSPAQRDFLDKCTPERVTLSNGRKPKVIYEAAGAPYISLRVQELYDVNEVVTIAMGRIKVLVHVLAPNQRPVQITDDLSSFWANSYEQVKKDLRGRYPKHEWR